jgi:hypothetical protein
METACERVLLYGKVRLRSVESILKKQLDRQPLPVIDEGDSQHQQQQRQPWQSHENVRGAEYFSPPPPDYGVEPPNASGSNGNYEGGPL